MEQQQLNSKFSYFSTKSVAIVYSWRQFGTQTDSYRKAKASHYPQYDCT